MRRSSIAMMAAASHIRNSGTLPVGLQRRCVVQEPCRVQIDKSVEAIALFWACVRGGFVFLPLNPAYTPSEISYFVSDAEPAVLVCDPSKAAVLGAMCKTVLTLDDYGGGSLEALASAQGHEFDDHDSNWDDLAAILYTSGTTGRSKGAMLTQANLASNALALVETWRFTGADTLIHALPVFHTHGLFVAMNTVFFSGGKMLYRRKFDSDDVMAVMPQATTMMGVPTMYVRLLQHAGLTRESTRHMRLFVSGSAPLLAETHNAFRERTGHAILERYGMTETNMNTSNPYEGERRAGTVGFALPGTLVRVVDRASGKVLPVGEDGMIEVKGLNVFKGYWRNPEKTAEDMTADGWFITGDVGRFDEQGYLVISGRAKDLIITGGYNVYPKEIELLLDQLPGVIESAVFGAPHPDFGEGVTAVVVAKSGFNEAGAIALLRKALAAFKVPKRIIPVEEMPRNAMGKVQKAVLREEYKALYRQV
jgi:malonyl-CoA/methylmalonyl-CoA synthetase